MHDTYQRYTIDDRSPEAIAFSRGADEGRPELMGNSAVISMTAGNGRSLSSILADFNQPPPQSPAPGSFVRQIEHDASEWGREFGRGIDEMQQAAKSYWAAPAVVASAPARPQPSALDSIGGLADGLANAMTGGSAAPEQRAIETSALGGSMRGNFGQLAESKPEDGLSAFERRYQSQAPRKPGGNDYV